MGGIVKKGILAFGLMLGLSIAAPAYALQCVPYARQVSGLELSGDAWRWWSAAQGVYDRGSQPQVGGVLVFKQTSSMRHGHVAVVKRVINRREIRIDHANWGNGRRGSRGQVHLDVAVLDVSPNNDWTQVRVWHEPSDTFGVRVNPAYGFIYRNRDGQPTRPRFDDAVLTADAGASQVISGAALPPPVSVSALSLPDLSEPAETRRKASSRAKRTSSKARADVRGGAKRVLQTVQPAAKPAEAKKAGKVVKVSLKTAATKAK